MSKFFSIDDLPQGWEIAKLGDLGNFKNGINKDKKYFGKGHPFLNLNDVFGASSIAQTETLGRLETTASERDIYNLCAGDVVFIRSSVKPSGVGLTSLIDGNLVDAVYSGFLLRFRSSNKLSKNFKKYCFSEKGFRRALISSSTISANTNINQKALSNLPLVFPTSIKEQEAIAEALSDADALIEGLERLIAKKRLIKQGAMQDLLTAKRRLPGFSGEWMSVSLKQLIQGSPQYGVNAASVPLGSGDFPYLRITDIDTHGRLKNDGRSDVKHHSAQHYILQPNDICVARTGASTGKSYIYAGLPENLVFAGFLIRLRPDFNQVDANYLAYSLNTDYYWRWIAENSARSGQPGINGQQLANLSISLPVDIGEQQAISGILLDMDAEIQALETRLDKARQVKEGMMQNLLTGRIRLV